MEQSPSWEANSSSANQEIPRVLWNRKVHYRIHKHKPPVPVLSHKNQIHDPRPTFFNICFNIVLQSTHAPSK